MQLQKLLNGLDLDIKIKKEITSIAYDSRKVISGSVFVCIKGYTTDGHNYVKQVEENGATVIIAQDEIISKLPVIYVKDTRLALAIMSCNYYDNPSEKFTLIGITGTNGKTTTTYLMKSILELAGKKVGLIGTNQNMIADKIVPSKHTTPESLELQELFNDMVNEKVDYVVMEVSSHSLELDRVYGCDFDIGVFTNITQDHLDFHKNMDNYLNAKKKLFTMTKKAVVNIDDINAYKLLDGMNCPAITVGIDKDATLHASDIKISERGVIFNLQSEQGKTQMQLGIPGKFSVYNALCAIGVAYCLGFEMEDIAKGLRIARGVKGRAELVHTKRDYTILIDYAHTPDGVYNIISTVREFAKGRVVTLFGCGGDRDKTKRPIMGKIAGELSDFCIVTSDNPRSEKPEAIIDDIVEGIKDTKCEYVVIEDRFKAIEYAIKNAKKDDIIILAGKGHETYQILADRTIEFDEKAIVEQLTI